MSTLENPSSQLATVLKFYEAIIAWKFEDLEELFSEDYRSKTLPATANQPIRNKVEGIEHARDVGAALGFAPLKVCVVFFRPRIAFLMRVCPTPQYEIYQFIETEGKIWAHVRCEDVRCDFITTNRLTTFLPCTYMQSKIYNDDIKFNNESIFVFSLSSGDNVRITGIDDFIDTKLAADYAAAAKPQ